MPQLDKTDTSNIGRKGNILFIILIAVALLAALSAVVTRSTNDDHLAYGDAATRDEQISRLLTYSSTLSAAIRQMIASGADPASLYSNLSTLVEGDVGWNTAPHRYKIHHPYGGGVAYMSRTGPSGNSSTVAWDTAISPDSIVTGVGGTDVTIGDIVFIADVNNNDSCERINDKLYSSITMPVMSDAAFTALFNATTTTIDGTNCANCVNRAQACITNVSGNAWGYYHALLPG
ncbi:MAG: hypothetical protein OXT65_06030 [Alphaproteobacteria bacterium]|nr:hypothetical protein [Alphaproteobacteria bacterium]